MDNQSRTRRELDFATLDDVLAEADRLLSGGYESRGNWTLGQAASHVSDWMRFPLDGFPPPPIWLRPIFWVMRHTVAPGMKKKILAEGFRPGTPTAPDTVPAPDAISDAEGVRQLHQTVRRVRDWEGPLHASPLFGPMDKDTLLQVSRLHAAHHFGFLAPKND